MGACSQDLVYVSSDNTVTVLLGAFQEKTEVKMEPELQVECKRGEETGETEPPVPPDLLHDLCYLDRVSDLQVFETQLSVSSLVCSECSVLLATMYHVIMLTKAGDRYTQRTLISSEEVVLSVGFGDEGRVCILTESKFTQGCVEGDMFLISSTLDIEGMWRTVPVNRAVVLPYRDQIFIIVEASAVHFLSEDDHRLPLTVPTEYLEFTEHFLDVHYLADKLYLVSTNYLLVYAICEGPCLVLERQVSHNVTNAGSAQFYRIAASPGDIHFSVLSHEKCSLFQLSDLAVSEHITMILPYQHLLPNTLSLDILLRPSYLALPPDHRNTVTRRVQSGASCALVHPTCPDCWFLLTETKDLFVFGEHSTAESRRRWEGWISGVACDPGYWVKTEKVDLCYRSFLSRGLVVRGEVRREREAGGIAEVQLGRDAVLDKVDDKYATSLIDSWNWS